MCTAISYKTKNFYFGRTLDYDCSYGEQVTITPRNYPLRFRMTNEIKRHYAYIGMAHVADGYPLYYDGGNEEGLAVAGLNFVGNACFFEARKDKIDLAQFELIPYLLGVCKSAEEAVSRLREINLVSLPFSDRFPVAELHYLIADKNGSYTVEFVKEGLCVYENPVGVLTNNPPFPAQLLSLGDCINVTSEEPRNRFSEIYNLAEISRGMGALGLPGDWSSKSRFARAAFVKLNSVPAGDGEEESVNEFFHVMNTVSQPRGSCRWKGGYEITVYTSCFSAQRGAYYYTAYGNHRICGVELFKHDLEGERIAAYPLMLHEDIAYQT